MNEENMVQDEEIDLVELFAILWQRKVMIITITVIAAIGVMAFSIISLVLPPETSPLPNKYTPTALMLIDNNKPSLSPMLGGMADLAVLAGLNVPADSNFSDLAVYLVGTNALLDSVVDKFGLIKRYKIKKSPRASSRKELKKFLQADYDKKSGVLSISFTDIDPVFAKDVVNYCVDYLKNRFDELGLDKNKIERENLESNLANTLNELEQLEERSRMLEHSVASASLQGKLPAITMDINRISLELAAKRQVYTQLKVQYELLRVTMASEKPVFQILELAEVSDKKSKPSRGLICIITTFAAGFFAIFLAFVLNSIANVKNDPEVMAKLRGKSEK